MLFNIPYLEWIGYFGSVIVAVSLTMSSIKKLRWYNLLGAAVFSFYGFAIGALPVGFLNLFIVVADTYYIYKMYSFKESFKSLLVSASDSYLNYYIDFYKNEIKDYFPAFNKSILTDKNVFAFLLLRNEVVVGVFVGTKEEQSLKVQLDFVTVAYRDLKPGDFIYKQNIKMIKDLDISCITSITDNKIHQKYLRKMGFERLDSISDTYHKNI
ncbi:MAG: hypothetical protein PHS59_09655 [Paludibacter sp.]|nr:hypothetical protein [Paludibacter sp.]